MSTYSTKALNFVAFLEKKGVLEKFISNCEDPDTFFSDQNFNVWKGVDCGAFVWSFSLEGYDYWAEIVIEWENSNEH